MLSEKILSTAVKFGKNTHNFTFDNRELYNGADTSVLMEIADDLWSQIKHLGPEVLVGKGVGAYSLLVAIKLRAYMLDQINLTILFVRDARKTSGAFKKLVEGPPPNEVLNKKAVFIDDLYNTGTTFITVKDVLFEEGFDLSIIAAATAVDFWRGSRALFAVGFPFFSTVTRHSLGLTRQDSGLPNILTHVRWELDLHHRGVDYIPVKSTPVIHEGLLYLGNNDTHQYCYDVLTGDLVWKYESMLPALKGNASTAQIQEGKLYWSTYDGVVRCVYAKTGQHIWASKVDTYLHASPCLDIANDRLFIATEWNQCEKYGHGDIVALQASTGHEIWRTPTKGMIPCTPTYSSVNDWVICGSNDFHVYILSATDGRLVFKVPTKGEVKSKPTLSEDQASVVVSTNTGYIYAISLLTQEILWERRIDEKPVLAQPIVEGFRVYITNETSNTFCLNLHTGKIMWVTRLRGEIGRSILSTDSCLIVGTMDKFITCLDKMSGKKLTKDKLKELGTFQPVAYDKATQSLVISTSKGIICYDVVL